MATYPDSTKTSLEQRLRARARERWPQIASLQIRHRGVFSYIDATLTDATTLKLCRLRYVGSAHDWQFAIYRASHDDYDESVFFTGLSVGTCQDALDTACGLYLNDPTAWTRHPTNLRARPLRSVDRSRRLLVLVIFDQRPEGGAMINVDLTGQTAVVTGASRGIGLAVTRVLAASGAHVVAGALHSSAELGKLAAEGSVTISELDLAAPGGPADLVALAGTRVDILVNNVGGAPPRTSGFLAITDEEWLATLNLNLMTAVRASRAALPAMLAAGQGAIVNICSVNSMLSDPAVMDYSAAKAAVASSSKALSKEVGPKGIRVNTVSPGPVATDLWLGANGVAATVGNATGARPEDVASSAASEMVTGRFSRPEEGR